MSAPASDFEPLNGHCACKAVTYSILAEPLATHCCHCTWCQRETGSAFVLNSMIEAYNFRITSDTQPTIVPTASLSGTPQLIARCPTCFVAVYSHYGEFKAAMFVRVGTLADGSRQRVRPTVHIFTSTKLEWLDLSAEKERGVKIFEEYYDRDKVWTKESLERRLIMFKRLEEEKAKEGGKSESAS